MGAGYFVQMKPFDEEERKDEKKVKELQEGSLYHGICGMGWDDSHILSENKGRRIMLAKYRDEYQREYEKRHNNGRRIRGLTYTLNRYTEIKEGDYLLTRLNRSQKCYIGKVKGEAYYCKQEMFDFPYAKNYSWVVDVEWKPAGNFSGLPNALRGALSGRWTTIKKMDEFHYDIVKMMFEGKIEKRPITKSNFHLTLDPMDLEDLVAMYMLEQNPSYRLLPSSCKRNEVQIEFIMVDGSRQITCQVKNEKEINLADYLEIEKDYEKIYFFSGEKVSPRELAALSQSFQIIGRTELYNFLKRDFMKKGYFYTLLSDLYDLD